MISLPSGPVMPVSVMRPPGVPGPSPAARAGASTSSFAVVVAVVWGFVVWAGGAGSGLGPCRRLSGPAAFGPGRHRVLACASSRVTARLNRRLAGLRADDTPPAVMAGAGAVRGMSQRGRGGVRGGGAGLCRWPGDGRRGCADGRLRRRAGSSAKSPEQKSAPLSAIAASTGMSSTQNPSWARRQNPAAVTAVSSSRASM